MGDETSQGTTHDLLLALAGRVDDDLLSWARELVALGEDARAVEMLTASLVAAHAVLPAPLRAALVAAAHVTRTDLGPAAALPEPRPEDGTEHRFAAPDGDDPVADALLDIPARPLAGCRVLLTRRLTPAGAAPGPLPHPVVLVEVHGTRPPEVLAYQLAAALERAGTPASVEVLVGDAPLPAYHAAAFDSAVELRSDTGGDAPGRLVGESGRRAGRIDAGTDHRVSERSDDRIDHAGGRNDAGATAVLPTAPARPAPAPARPAEERHALAPPVGRAVDQPTYRLEERLTQEPTPRRRPPEPLEGSAEESRADEPLPRRRPLEPAPAEPFGGSRSVEPLARRRIPAPAPRHPPEEPFGSHRLTGVEPSRGPGPEPDDDGGLDHAAAEPATGRMRSTPGQPPERESEDAATVTGRLRAEAGGTYRPERGPQRDDRRTFDETRVRSEELPEPDEPAPSGEPHPLAAPRPLPGWDESRQAPRPKPVSTSAPTPVQAPTTRPRPTVTPISRTAMSSPIPLVRRGGQAPIPRPFPITEPRPTIRRLGDEDTDQPVPPADERVDHDVDEVPTRSVAPGPVTKPERVETSAFDSLSDPLNGPLHQPLLAPLLDPTDDDDPLGLGARQQAGADDSAEDDEWSEDWVSGTWAMAPSAAFGDRADDRTDGLRDREPDADPDDDGDESGDPSERRAPRPAPRRSARHRYTDDTRAHDGTSRAEPQFGDDPDDDPEDDERDHVEDDADDLAETADAREPGGAEPAQADLGLRPESLARLSDADRQLLARLQAELLEGRKPRISRRPGIANGSGGTGASANGSHRGAPPDLAG